MIPVKRQLETTDESSEAGMLYSINVGDIYSPLKGIDSTQSPASCKRSRRQDLKVDGPLTPPASERCPPWDSKKVSVSEVLQDVMPHLPPPIPAPEQISSEDIDMLFAEHIAPIAAKADRAIEQEQLQEADTTSRVQVPTMDFTKPIPPWHIAPSENIHDWKKRFLHEIKESHLNIPLWLQEGPTKEGLSWAPFPISLGRFDLKETIEDDGSLTAFITDPEAIDPETLTWKPPGLRIFDESHNSEEEELAYGVFPPAGDVDSLIKERVLELQNEDELDSGLSSARKPEASTEQFTDGPTRLKGRAASGNRQAVPPTVDDPAQIAKFSAVNALDQFLGIRKGELSRSKGPTENLASASALKVSKETVESADIIVSEKSTLAAPRPKFQVPDCPHYFVASTSFLSNRRLAHQVKNLYPSAIIIERDFTIYGLRSPDAEKNLHTARTGPEIPSDEADLILSPGTGLIITSLQKIKQQSLPGEVTRSPVRARIQRTAPRYERLVVLVSIHSASSDDGAGIRGSLEESDCEALVSLTAYLDHLQTLSESELVLADGDTTALAVWVVSLMVRYSSEASITLLQEETQWEVFLRQAGMNAFAAQVVVAVMKAVKGKDGHPLGLRDLVFMSPEERYRRFEGLLGGRGMLERVGRVLDARW